MELEKEIHSRFRDERHKLQVNLIYTGNWAIEQFRLMLKPFGLSNQQYNLLRILRGQHPGFASIGLLRERMLDKSSDASRIVERLLVKGLVERIPSADDRRVTQTRITPKGLELLQKIDIAFENFGTQTDNLTDEEVRTANHLLDKLRG
jgi:DNA-binding MarR family transcriptional regulator